jgi:NAD(P)-dependent dehydrogenase (short-subunit alcohol dehydrogenase family)
MPSAGWSVQGRTVLVTGAARGIGAESARHLARRGANVALVGLEPEELEKVAAECGPNAARFEADVTDTGALDEAVSGTVECFGGIDVAMANAGIYAGGTVRSIEPAAFERTIEINLLGVWRTVRACLPHVLDRHGYILVTTSLATALHSPGMAAYAASKAGAEAFTNSLRVELSHLGVDVGAGYFAFIDTDLVRGGEQHPAYRLVRERTPWPFSKIYPVSDVGEAVADGVERRARLVLVPRWLRSVLALRGVLVPITDVGSRRNFPEIDARFEEDARRRGAESSAPVGAGGQAVRESVVNRG